MRLDDDESRQRLLAHDHGILCTVHPDRGVDAVPVVYATSGHSVNDGVGGDMVAIPVDRVKPKASTRLQRERNLEADPRAALLIERWDPHDWSKLWWVRVELRWNRDPPARSKADLTAALVERYPQYRDRDRPFADVLVLAVTDLTGWSAADPNRKAGSQCSSPDAAAEPTIKPKPPPSQKAQ